MYTTVNKDAVTGEVTIHQWTSEEIEARKQRLLPGQWKALRAERTARLAKSDVYVTMDRWDTYTTEQKLAWSKYRQDLRDLPENTLDPFNPLWPTSPE